VRLSRPTNPVMQVKVWMVLAPGCTERAHARNAFDGPESILATERRPTDV